MDIFFFWDLFFSKVIDTYTALGSKNLNFRITKKTNKKGMIKMNDNITKLNMVIKTLENDIEERNNLNLLAKKAITDTKKKIKALEKLEAKEREILGDMFNNDACPTLDAEEELDCGNGTCTCEHEEIPVIY